MTPPTIEPALEDMVDWSNVSAPEHSDDTRCVQFYLSENDAGFVYEGLLFYRSAPVSVWKAHGPHFHGTGHLIPTGPVSDLMLGGKPLPAMWARAWIPVEVGVAAGFGFYDDGMSSLPEVFRWELESDVDGGIVGRLDLEGHWDLVYTKTTAALAVP